MERGVGETQSMEVGSLRLSTYFLSSKSMVLQMGVTAVVASSNTFRADQIIRTDISLKKSLVTL